MIICFIKLVHEHWHDSSAALIEVTQIRNELKRRAEETIETPAQIMNTSLYNSTAAAKTQAPNKEAMRKIIMRKRNEVAAAPPNPDLIEELVIPDEYKYINGELFLVGDSLVDDLITGDVQNRIFLFARSSIQHWIEQVKTIYIDGTFRQAPPLFAQIYVIMGERLHSDGKKAVFPLMYALLPNKRADTYTKMF